MQTGFVGRILASFPLQLFSVGAVSALRLSATNAHIDQDQENQPKKFKTGPNVT